jgi:serine/threonine protein kinase
MQLDSNELYRTGGGSTLRAGLVLQHKFTLLNHIAGGGMGEVWLAADSSRPENGKPSRVALKFLHAPLRFNPEADRTFRKEFQRVWKLRSKNICELKELGHEPEIGSFIVMEYLEGETLRDTLARSPSGLPFDTAIKVLAAVASALDLAHAPPTNIIHCDVKPENIIYNPRTGSVHVIDFGIAAEISRFSRSAVVPLGTPAYMAPEQWNHQSPTRHSDIWSLGVLAAELLTGQLPFNCPNVAFAAHGIQNSRPTPLQGHLQNLNPVFDIVFSRIPQNRFPDCNSFLQALQSAHQRLPGSPVKTRAFLTINNIPRPSLISLAIISAMIAALALPTSTIWLTEPTQSQSPPTTSQTSGIPQHDQAELSMRSVPPLPSQTAPPTTQALTANSTPSAPMKTKTATSEPVPGAESNDRKDASLIPSTAMKIDKRFRDYLETHPALLTADASAEIVYINDTKQFMIIAVGSSSLRARNPRTACELKALASLAAAQSRMDIRKTVQLDDLGAISRITTSLESTTYGLPAVTEWISSDGQSITILYGQIVDITDHLLKKGI